MLYSSGPSGSYDWNALEAGAAGAPSVACLVQGFRERLLGSNEDTHTLGSLQGKWHQVRMGAADYIYCELLRLCLKLML